MTFVPAPCCYCGQVVQGEEAEPFVVEYHGEPDDEAVAHADCLERAREAERLCEACWRPVKCSGCGQVNPPDVQNGEHWRRLAGSKYDAPRYEPCGELVEDEDEPDERERKPGREDAR